MRLKPLALGAMFCASTGATAQAQIAQAQEVPTVGAQREYHGSVSLQAIYDSNFARSSKALADLRGIVQKEVTLRPQANLNVVQPFGKQLVFLQGLAAYDFHDKNERLDGQRYDAQGGYAAAVGICQLAAIGGYHHAQSDLATIDTLQTKNTNKAVATSAEANCGRPTGFGGTLKVQRIDVKNSAEVQKSADSTLETLYAVIRYSQPSLGSLGLMYNYANNELPNRINPGRPVGDGFWTQSFGIAGERDIGSRLTITGQLGKTKVKREFAPPGLPQKFNSTTYAADATYRFGDRLVLTLQGERAVKPTASAGKLYDVDTNGQINGRYRFGTRFVAQLGYGISDIESNTDTISARPVVTDSRTHSVFGSLRYSQSERWSVVLDVRHDDRSTNLPDFNYNNTRVGLSAEVGF